MKLVFMGTPAFAVPTLKALHAAGHEIVAVYTQPPRPSGRGQKETPSLVHVFAEEHKLPVYTHASLKSPEVQAEFKAHEAEAAVVVAYGLLLPKPILEAYPLGCINVHPSLLPRWRGAAPIQRTVMAGDKETAIVIMQMDEGLDTGDMLMLDRFLVPDDMNAGQLHNLLAERAGPLVVSTLEGLAQKRITPQKQPEEGVTYAKKITKAEAKIDWTLPAEEIRNHIRGLTPTPGAYFTHNCEAIKVFDAEHAGINLKQTYKPGTVVDYRLSVACGEGVLRLMAVQRPGKKRCLTAEMLNGFPIPAGTVLD